MSSICIQWRHAGAGLPGTGHRASPRCAPGSRPHPWPAGPPARSPAVPSEPSAGAVWPAENAVSIQIAWRRSRSSAQVFDEAGAWLRHPMRPIGQGRWAAARHRASSPSSSATVSPLRVWPSRLRYFPAAWLRVSSGSAGLGVPGSAPAGDGTWCLTDSCDAWAQVTTVAAEVAQLFGVRP